MKLVIVTGLFGTGTSAVAAALHAMGVPMGFSIALPRAPFAYLDYEDDGVKSGPFSRYLETRLDREQRYSVACRAPLPEAIGCKSPLLAESDALDVARAMGLEPVVIVTSDPPDEDSIRRNQGSAAGVAFELNRILAPQLECWRPDLAVSLRNLRADPEAQCHAIAETVGVPGLDPLRGARAIFQKESTPCLS